MAKSTRGVRPGRRHPNTVAAPWSVQHLRHRDLAPDLSRDARRRLTMLDWHWAHGGNVSRTARHFGYSRPTVYRWLRRFERDRLEAAEPDLAAFQTELQAWEVVYNTIRPHQALAYLTPAEYLASVGVDV